MCVVDAQWCKNGVVENFPETCWLVADILHILSFP
jgi:hypothetical protein